MMKIPIKFKREYLLIAGTLTFLYISYKLAFKKTIDAMQVHHNLTSELATVSDLSDQPGYLERKNNNLDAILGRYNMDSLSLRGYTIAMIAQIADREHVKLSDVPNQDPMYRNEHLIIQRLDFDGDYFALTRLLHQLESTSGIGVPRSVTWKSMNKVAGNHNDKRLSLQVCFEMGK